MKSSLKHYPELWWSLVAGYVAGLKRHAWWSFLLTLVGVVAFLILGPLLLNEAASALRSIGVNGIDNPPEVKDWFSLTNVILLMLGVSFVRWLLQARSRVLVESFVDFTKDDATAVSGLSTLLVTELGRLRELYHQIDDISVPTAVGVERHGGFGRGKEAGVFLTVSADDRSNVLAGAVASDASIQVGPAKLPIGPLFNFLNRVTSGPRVGGSVHLTEAGGGPTLTAQLIGKDSSLTWRVDESREPESAEQRKAFLDSMVRELACRMFTQLTLGDAVRWKAVLAFNEYLRLYGDSRRTPRDRARFLKLAQGELLRAVAEDETFDLAYYNLGVIYTQLADTERLAEQRSEDATARTSFKRFELEAARREAARVAFVRAAAMNPNRWEACYAQAVTRFSAISSDVKIDETLPADDKRRDELGAVIALCDQALAVSPGQEASVGAVYDLRGMAESRLADDFPAAMRSHRKAVRHSWSEYCQARRSDLARPAGRPGLSDHARANATAALHNLALAYERRALEGRGATKLAWAGRRDLDAAQRLFHSAEKLAGEGSTLTGASRFERANALEQTGDFEEAAAQFERAGAIHPKSPEYRARRARALAYEWRRLSREQPDEPRVISLKGEARAVAGRALELLAQPFSVAVVPYTTEALDLQCEATMNALEGAYGFLGDEEGADRIRGVRDLKQAIEDASSSEDPVTKQRCKRRDPKVGASEMVALRGTRQWPSWELNQLDLAIGRLYADARIWDSAREAFDRLVSRVREEDELERIVEFGAYAHQARAQRECGDYVTALMIAAEGARRDPLDLETRREAGRAHFALGQFTDALDAWEHALWLSPSDPYLHYEVAMCHRRRAQDEPDKAEHERIVKCAKEHFEQARELFDGEDLDGEAWARLWLGKVALEERDLKGALAHMQGAEHGNARAAAALLLGEAHLLLDQRPAADHAFKRCEEVLEEKERWMLAGRDTIDALWGDELPLGAVWARIFRGQAESKYLAPGDWQGPDQIVEAWDLIAEAHAYLEQLEDAGARDQAMTRVLDTESSLLQAERQIGGALDRVRERLRYEVTPEAQQHEAELLDLRVKSGGTQIDETTLVQMAADHAWEKLPPHKRRNARRK